jgi:hypothetical protein
MNRIPDFSGPLHMRAVIPDLIRTREDLAQRLRRYADSVESGDRLALFEVARALKQMPTAVYGLAQSWSYVHDTAH